jgi:amino acid adenylation domain-containing protein
MQRFARSCAEWPGRPAFVIADTAVTYRELAGLVQAIRDLIRRVVADDERRIAIHATQDVWTYASILAVLADGRAYVPLNPHAPMERNRSCVDQAGIRTLLCSRTVGAVSALRDAVGDGLRVEETTGVVAAERLESIPPVDEDAIAYLLFTSGSTGLPKGVPVHHRNLNAFIDAFVDRGGHGFTEQDRFLQMFDLTFDLSVMSYGVPLCVGAACHPVPEGGPAGFLGVAKTLDRGAVTVALMVPSVLAFLERYFDEIRLPALRLSMFCGEALPARIARAWWTECAPAARLLNVYGPTEATIFCSSYELATAAREDEAYNGVVSIGEPMERTAFRVVAGDLSTVPAGEKGELVIIGDQVTDGYWQDPVKTAAAFITLADGTRGYRSGDVVFARDGRYYYCGRTDHQLKVDGYRVEAGEIEHCARDFRGVSDAAVVGKTENGGRTVLHLFLLFAGEAPPAFAKECRTFLAQRLPPYMVPQRMHALPQFPLNANGKVDRKALIAGLGA